MRHLIRSLTVVTALVVAQTTAAQSAAPVPAGYKDPQVATVAGVLVAGGAQFYTGRYVKGAALLATHLVGLGFALAGPTYHCSGLVTQQPAGEEPAYYGCATSSYTKLYEGLALAGLSWTIGWATARRDADAHNAALGIAAGRIQPVFFGRKVGVAVTI